MAGKQHIGEETFLFTVDIHVRVGVRLWTVNLVTGDRFLPGTFSKFYRSFLCRQNILCVAHNFRPFSEEY